ncbi:MAG: TatD family hydrolase, partial [Candidatus Woesearchaeota archaeon]
MKLIDIHAHMDMHEYGNDLSEVLQRAEKAGVAAVISNGTDKNSNRKVLELSRKYPLIKAALGLYPMDALRREQLAMKMKKEDIDINVDEEIEFIKKHRDEVIALGEIGLDFMNSNA